MRLHTPPRNRRGFTLIELLTVIGIIAVLVSILLPVLAQVRKKGYETSTTAELGRIATGMIAYYNDFKAYPGPIPENEVDAGGASTSVPSIALITGSKNVTLGMLGGLKKVAGTISFDPTLVNTGVQSLNSLNPKTYSNYMDVTPEELTPKGTGGINYLDYTSATDNTGAASNVPEFLDHCPGQITGSVNANFQTGPILYMRCRVGASGNTGTQPSSGVIAKGSQTTPKAPYFFDQLARYNFNTTIFTAPNQGSIDFPTGLYPDSTTAYFASPTNPGQPRGKDSFILISAGSDRIYGTKDDIFYSN